MINEKGNATDKGSLSVMPSIVNTNLTLSAFTYEWFSYNLVLEGTLPITCIINTPVEFSGELKFQNNSISGISYKSGTYSIPFTVLNNFGMSEKVLTLTIHEPVRITNTNLRVYSKVDSDFFYTITSSGIHPKIYSISGEPPSIYLSPYSDTIMGIFDAAGSYDITMTVDGVDGADSKLLNVISGYPPTITSSSTASGVIYEPFSYQITSSGSESTYKVIGMLPKGLKFRIDTISGTPTESCRKFVTLKVTNPYGESFKDLMITIYQI